MNIYYQEGCLIINQYSDFVIKLMTQTSTEIEQLMKMPHQYLKNFQNKYPMILSFSQHAYSKLSQKSIIGADTHKYIERSILTQQRLFQEILNLSTKLLEHLRNPPASQEKINHVNQNYSQAKKLHDSQKYKEARFYIDKNQPYAEGSENLEYQTKHYILKGEILHALREPEESNYYLEKPQILQMNDPEILYSIALNYLSLGDKEKKPRGRKPKRGRKKMVPPSEISFTVVNKDVDKQHVRKAIEYFHKVLELKPEEYNVYDDLCEAYRLTGNTKGYIETKMKQQDKETDPYKLFISYSTLARYLNFIDEKEQSINIYDKAFNQDIDPDEKLTLISQIVQILQIEENNHHKMLPYLQKSIQIIKQKSPIQQLKYSLNFSKVAKCYQRSSQYEKQLQIYLYLLKIREDLSLIQPKNIYQDIGVCFYRLGNYPLAEKFLHDYLSKDKFKRGIYFLLGEMYIEKDDYFAAKDILLKLKSFDNERDVVERLLVIEREVGTQAGIEKLEGELRIMDL